MEFLTAIALLLVIGVVGGIVYYFVTKDNETPAEKLETEKARFQATAEENFRQQMRNHRPTVPPASPPPPAMRTSSGRRGPTPPPAPINNVRRDERPVDTSFGVTDVLVATVIVDALTPDPASTREKPTITSGGGNFGGGGASSSWGDDSSSCTPSRDYSSDYGSSSSSSSDSYSSSDSGSSSSPSCD